MEEYGMMLSIAYLMVAVVVACRMAYLHGKLGMGKDFPVAFFVIVMGAGWLLFALLALMDEATWKE